MTRTFSKFPQQNWAGGRSGIGDSWGGAGQGSVAALLRGPERKTGRKKQVNFPIGVGIWVSGGHRKKRCGRSFP